MAPFAFVVFYAALQTVDQDTLESAIVDGASRLERLRYVVIPHLMPLILFVSMIHLMDSYRVFDEIVGFSAQAHVISLQYLTLFLPHAGRDREPRRGARRGLLDADDDRHRPPAHPSAQAHLARPACRKEGLMADTRALAPPFWLKLTSGGFLLLWLVVALFPLLWIALMSLRAPVDALSANPLDVLFGRTTFEHYQAVWVTHGFWRNFLNSMVVTAGVVTVSLTSGRWRAMRSRARARVSPSGC